MEFKRFKRFMVLVGGWSLIVSIVCIVKFVRIIFFVCGCPIIGFFQVREGLFSFLFGSSTTVAQQP